MSVMSGAGHGVGVVMVIRGWCGRCSVEGLGSDSGLNLKSLYGKEGLWHCAPGVCCSLWIYADLSTPPQTHTHKGWLACKEWHPFKKSTRSTSTPQWPGPSLVLQSSTTALLLSICACEQEVMCFCHVGVTVYIWYVILLILFAGYAFFCMCVFTHVPFVITRLPCVALLNCTVRKKATILIFMSSISHSACLRSRWETTLLCQYFDNYCGIWCNSIFNYELFFNTHETVLVLLQLNFIF